MDPIASAMQAASNSSQVGIEMLKKAQDMAVGELQLLQNLPTPSPEGVGTKIDVQA